MIKYVKGITAIDSKGGYDAVTKSEGPMLGLSNARSALQAYQLREQLAESFCRSVWISGDWNLSDALTKKARVAREGELRALATAPGEVAACRAAFGALQWLATQTQVHICARVNLLLTELTVTKTLQTAKEIQAFIKEAHAKRPQGGSTGGYLTLMGGPQIAQGEAGRLSWTWRLKRKAISTNDGEIQSMVDGEDANFRTRGFDAVNKNESPLLGLSNVRGALQTFQLREQLQDSDGNLIWIAGYWNLGDCLTKKDKSARAGIMQFFRNWIWKLTYDPNFIQSEKKAKKAGQGAVAQMRQLQSLIP
eukprot:s2780_g4.t1